jgi:sarcosine oxidase subunit gamma
MARAVAKPKRQASEETAFRRVSPLADVAVQGRFGADVGAPGVIFSVRHPLAIVMVIARAGGAEAVAKVMARRKAQWAGPEQYFVVVQGLREGELARELKEELRGHASVIDQSHGRIVIRIAGPKARSVLAKGTPVDLHPEEFPVGKSALTQMAHVGVHLSRVGEDAYDLSLFRGFAESFWEWITEQGEEFGYQVT